MGRKIMPEIVTAGEKTDHIDLAAAKERGVIVCNVPGGLNADNVKDAQEIAVQVVDNIHAWLDDKPINVID